MVRLVLPILESLIPPHEDPTYEPLATALSTTAKLAFLNLDPSPDLDPGYSFPPSDLYAYGKQRKPSKLSTNPRFSNTQLLSIAVVFVVLLLQFFRPAPLPANVAGPTSPEQLAEPYESAPLQHCQNCPNPLAEPLPFSKPSKMALMQAAEKAAAEFEYNDQEVNKGVHEFLRQMGKLALALALRFETVVLIVNRRRAAKTRYSIKSDTYICHCCTQWHREGNT